MLYALLKSDMYGFLVAIRLHTAEGSDLKLIHSVIYVLSTSVVHKYS